MLKRVLLASVIGLLMVAAPAQADDRQANPRPQAKPIVINVDIVARPRAIVSIDVVRSRARLEVAQNRGSFVSKVEDAAQRDPF